MTSSWRTRYSAAAAGRPRCWPKWKLLMRDSQPAGARQRYGDVAGLLAGATERTVFTEEPGKSGDTLERVVIDGRRYVLKNLDFASACTLRQSGCLHAHP